MNYAFKYASLPKHAQQLLKNLDEAAARLAVKLEKTNVQELNISDYNKRYLGGTLQNIKAALQLRTYLLGWALKEINIPIEQIILFDYGGGSGMLSLLAKEYGIGTVIYDDIYEVSCRDASVIGASIGNKADYYVNGDIDDLIQFVQSKNLSCTVLVSYDVLEHIYNVPLFLAKLPQLSNGLFTVVMGSGANMKNPFVNKVLRKKQIELEAQDRQAGWGAKDRDALKSYLGIRRGMIQSYLQEKRFQLSHDIIEELAKRTRGKIKKEIEEVVELYIQTKQLPQPLAHPTNTCDPNNGNWAEHLMDTNELRIGLEKAGFESQILSGYYGDSNHFAKRIVGRLLNAIISVTGKAALILSSFYVLYGVRKASNQKASRHLEKKLSTTAK